jgi:hypothetical protein
VSGRRRSATLSTASLVKRILGEQHKIARTGTALNQPTCRIARSRSTAIIACTPTAGHKSIPADPPRPTIARYSIASTLHVSMPKRARRDSPSGQQAIAKAIRHMPVNLLIVMARPEASAANRSRPTCGGAATRSNPKPPSASAVKMSSFLIGYDRRCFT